MPHLPCAAMLLLCAAPAIEEPSCVPAWSPAFGSAPGTTDWPRNAVVFDDGSGAALYVCGEFDTAGGVEADAIAKWDGAHWSTLGSGFNKGVYSIVVHDDGSGPALYAGGNFTTAGDVAANRIAKWDGASWSPVGSGADAFVYTLFSYDDGSGSALYAGGPFEVVGGVTANGIARWDGSSWSAVGGGMSPPNANGVSALESFDDGSGVALYAAGRFSGAGGVTAQRIAKWDGSTWSALGSGLSGSGAHSVQDLIVHDDGSGTALYVAGRFDTAGGVPAANIAKWDGSSWSTVGDGAPGSEPVHALAVLDTGGGPELYIGGEFSVASGAPQNYVAKWDGAGWAGLSDELDGWVEALCVFDDGAGDALYGFGLFDRAGDLTVHNVARWDGSSWSAVGSGADAAVYALAVHDDGGGAALFAGGEFDTIASTDVNQVAKWDGGAWSDVGGGVASGSGFVSVKALASFDDGTGPALYASGWFDSAGGTTAAGVAQWDGASWSALGTGVDEQILAFAVHDDGSGSALYAGGRFFVAGGVSSPSIARWNGTAWSAVGVGLPAQVNALAVHDDGSGVELFAAGDFWTAGGMTVNRIAKWDGASWSALDAGLGSTPGGETARSLAVFDDGTGPALYAGGLFTFASGLVVNHIARWDGTSWSALGGGVDHRVSALTVFDDGSGPALYAGGSFQNAGGQPAQYLARWDGTSWSAVGAGLEGPVSSLQVFDGGTGPELFIGGFFKTSALGDSYLAKWGGCDSAFESYCTAGTSASGCQALISASGTPSASATSGFDLIASTVEGSKDGLFFYGSNGRQANTWGSGTSFVCVVPPRLRGGLLIGTGTPGACDGAFAQDLNARWCATCPKPSHNPGAGTVMQAQLWYRDPQNTSNQTSSMSDAIEFSIYP